jgi:hypothetical protein
MDRAEGAQAMTKLIEPEKDAHKEHNDCAVTADSSIWEVIDEIMRSVPEEARQRLPADGAEQHDHYLYGSPKRAPRES